MPINLYIKVINVTIPKLWHHVIRGNMVHCIITYYSQHSTLIGLNEDIIKCVDTRHDMKYLQPGFNKHPINIPVRIAGRISLFFSMTKMSFTSKDSTRNEAIWIVLVPGMFSINLTLTDIKTSSHSLKFCRNEQIKIYEDDMRILGIYCGRMEDISLYSHSSKIYIGYVADMYHHYFTSKPFTATYQIIDRNIVTSILNGKYDFFSWYYIFLNTLFVKYDVIGNYQGYRWTIQTERYYRLMLHIFAVGLQNDTYYFLYDGPGPLSHEMFNSSIVSDDDVIVNSSTYVVHMVMLSQDVTLGQKDLDGTYNTTGTYFIKYSYFSGTIKELDIMVPDGMILSFPQSCKTEHGETFKHCAFKITSPTYVELKIKSIIFTGPQGVDCIFGGMTLYNVNQDTFSYLVGLCGQRYMNRLWETNDLPRPVTFVTIGRQLLIVFTLHSSYGGFNVSLSLSESRCRGLYPEHFLGKLHEFPIYTNVNDYSVVLGKDDCIQIHSSVCAVYFYNYLTKLFLYKSVRPHRENINDINSGIKIEQLYTTSSSRNYLYRASHGGLNKALTTDYWTYTVYIGSEIGIEMSSIFADVRPDEGLMIARVTLHTCHFNCKQLHLDGWIKTPLVGFQLCDVCHQMYISHHAAFQLQPNTCMKVISYPNNTGMAYDLYHSALLSKIGWSWRWNSGPFEIHGHTFRSHIRLRLNNNVETKSPLVLSVYPTDINVVDESAVPHVKACDSNCTVLRALLSVHFEGFRYTVHDSSDPMSWIAAQHRCQGLGGHLMSIHNNRELDILFKLLHNILEHQTVYYIGMYSKVSV